MKFSGSKFWLGVAIVAIFISSSPAYNLLGVKWPAGSSVVYSVNANTPDVGNEGGAVRNAADSWSSICPSSLQLAYGGSTSTTGSGSNGSNTVCWADEGDNGTLATAYIWDSGGTIIETDMVFNDFYNWDTFGGDYDVESVALHEFGHWVGLDHGPGVMSSSYGGIDRGIDSDSEAGFRDLYECGDGDGGGEAAPSIDLDRDSLTFYGGDEKIFNVRNSGGGTLDYQVSSDRAWINVSPESGSSTGEWDDITVTVDTSKLQVADYSGKVYVSSDDADNSPQVVSVTLEGFILTVEASSGGTTDPAPGTYTYFAKTDVTITAIPDSNARFSHWSEDASGSDNPITVTVDSSKRVKANFIRQFTLTLESGAGGTTNPSPGSYIYDEGTEVDVKADPDTNYRFTYWSGDASGTDNPITINMNSDKTIKANFVRVYNLTIASGPGGTTDPGPGTHTYDEGTSVEVKAIPDTNFRFLNWSEDASGTDNPISVTMNSDKSIKANFIRVYTLTIAAETGGTTDPAPGTYTHDEGTNISLKAIPDNHYVFEEWRGDASGATNPITITMDSDKTITARFRLIHKPLNFSGQKVLNRSLSQAEYIIVLTWEANPKNINIVNYKIYQLEGGNKNLLVELDSGTFEYWQRNVEKDKQYEYALVAVGGEGTEGEAAVVSVK